MTFDSMIAIRIAGSIVDLTIFGSVEEARIIQFQKPLLTFHLFTSFTRRNVKAFFLLSPACATAMTPSGSAKF